MAKGWEECGNDQVQVLVWVLDRVMARDVRAAVVVACCQVGFLCVVDWAKVGLAKGGEERLEETLEEKAWETLQGKKEYPSRTAKLEQRRSRVLVHVNHPE
jgi:hypothetical protein